MRRIIRFFCSAHSVCALWIALCFSLTSVAYLSWVYHLMDFAAPERVDVYSLILGYSCQAAGLAVGFLLFRKTQAMADWKIFSMAVLCFCVVTLPAIMGNTLASTLLFGLLMNVSIGVLAGFYLCVPAGKLKEAHRGKSFGFGYGLSTIFIFAVSLLENQTFLRSQAVLILVLLLAAAAIGAAFVLLEKKPYQETEKDQRAAKPLPGNTVWLAGAVVVLLSLVKNLGFSFRMEEIQAGSNLELSRLFYGAGLIAAGMIADKSRKSGATCTVTALVLPFVMLALSAESLPAMICWGLDYLFYGFFSVYRAVLFMDIAERNGHWPLAALGLLAGRAGDALGTACCRLFSFNRVLLIGFTLVLFVVTLLLFIRLCQRLYMPEIVREKSEREVFESFAIQHDLSAREREVLRLILTEQSVPQISEQLFVTESTVRYHIHHLLQKSGCKTRQELMNQYNIKRYPQITKE